VIIVDDHSNDDSYLFALDLERNYSEIKVIRHEKNFGKGAALRSGFKVASGDYVAVQDADLEYDPNDLKRLLDPLIEGKADVVLGSRFLSPGAHRVLYFWHFMGNRFLTFLSNMFTDLNLTDMETCYKVFRRDIIQNIDIEENRFGFEPEIIAKIAQLRLRIFEIGISYYGRTYAEGKKISVKDGFRALYCIFRYNAHKAPLPIQFLVYLIIGAMSATLNLLIFYILINFKLQINISLPTAFIVAAILNYILCIKLLFRHKAQWSSKIEIFIYFSLVSFVCLLDLGITKLFISTNMDPIPSKLISTISIFILNFFGRRYLVFSEPTVGPWNPQIPSKN
jgi:glycosyltransferase involved in cell wall biosynthesis